MNTNNDNSTPHTSTDYDKQILNTIPYYDKFHAETINLISTYNPEPKIWLDTGCGTGLLTEKCINQFPNTVFILSDPSEAMLQAAKEKFLNQSRVKTLEAVSTENIPNNIGYKPDVITAIQAHHYLSANDRIRATDVCYDLLDTDGIFVTFENISPMSQRGIEISKRYWGNYQLSKGKPEEQVEAHLARFGKEYFPITVAEHLKLYNNCGFKVVELFWCSYMQAGFFCIK